MTKYNIFAYINDQWIQVNKDLDVYTKSETDVLLVAKADANGVYSKEEVDTYLNLKADKSTTYTKTEVDALVNGAFDEDSYYNKTSIDNLLNDKADKSTVDTLTTQVNTNTSDISSLQTTVSGKADASTTYTKTETTNLISQAVSNLELFELVQTLPEEDIANNKIYLVPNTKNASQNKYDLYMRINDEWEKIDSIELDVTQFASASDMSTAQSDIETIQTTLSNLGETYYNKTQIDNSLTLKADASTTYTKTEVDTALNSKANQSTTYTKTETDTEISTAVGNHSIAEVVASLPATGNVDKLYLVPVPENNGE